MKRFFLTFLLSLVILVGCANSTKVVSPDSKEKAKTEQSAGRDAKSTTIQYISNGPSLWMIFLTQLPATMLGYWLGKGGWYGTGSLYWRRVAKRQSHSGSERDPHGADRRQ